MLKTETETMRATPWKPLAPGVEKRVRRKPGYDCRVICRHSPKGEHGQHGDELWLELRREDVAVRLQLYTHARDGVLEDSSFTRQYGYINAAWLHAHFGFVVEVADVRTGATPEKCDVLREGMCWSSEGSTSTARELFTDADKPAVVAHLTASDVELRVLDLVPEVWARMLAKMDSLRETALAAHAALPKHCHHCMGSGLLPPPA